MSNWYHTTISINCKNKDKLRDFDTKLDEFMSKDYTKNVFGLNWLGNIVGNSGIGTIDTGEITDLSCRGCVIYKDFINDEQLVIDTETAWVPMLKMWVLLLDKYLPEATLLYSAEECGNELYYTNNSFLLDKYIIDCFENINDMESNSEMSEEAVVKLLQKLLHSKKTDINHLMIQFHKSKYNNKLAINKWEYADIEKWE